MVSRRDLDEGCPNVALHRAKDNDRRHPWTIKPGLTFFASSSGGHWTAGSCGLGSRVHEESYFKFPLAIRGLPQIGPASWQGEGDWLSVSFPFPPFPLLHQKPSRFPSQASHSSLARVSRPSRPTSWPDQADRGSLSYLRPTFPLPLARPFFSPFFPISSRHHQPSTSEALAGLPSYLRPRFPSHLPLPFSSILLPQTRSPLDSLLPASQPHVSAGQADKGSSSYSSPSLPLLLARPLFSHSSRSSALFPPPQAIHHNGNDYIRCIHLALGFL